MLSVRALCKDYPGHGRRGGRLQAVDHVSLDLHPGQTVALVGESGSGKSTLAKLILRLETPSAGELRLDDVNVLEREPRRPSRGYRRRVQMVLQDPFASLNPARSVAHHLRRPLMLHHRFASPALRELRLEQLLETVELSPASVFAAKFPHELSGGQRQRVAIARALAVEPDFIVADEPTSMLDVSLRIGILELLDRLKREQGIGVLYITHDLGAARYIADRVEVMYRGQLVESLPADALAHAARHPYTQVLVAAASGAHLVTQPLEALGGARVRLSLVDAALPSGQAGCQYVRRCSVALARCASAAPEPQALSDAHSVRCWRVTPDLRPD